MLVTKCSVLNCVETDSIEHNVHVQHPESHISCITEGFNSMGFNDEVGTSSVAWPGE